ncbi:hypothetical protein Q3G72_024432 [Acer saccharum]|nr:hypothetical protein Q3G72_024432 [Acer saccharum]
MKYVKPCSLFYEMLKSAMELADKKPLGPQLLGLNLLEKHVTISISDPSLLLAIHYGVVERKRRNIHTIANLFRTLIPKYNLEGAVIGCPDIESIDNHEYSMRIVLNKDDIKDFDDKISSVFILQGYLDHCGRKVKPGPFDHIWSSESEKALYLQKLNQVKNDKLTNLGLLHVNSEFFMDIGISSIGICILGILTFTVKMEMSRGRCPHTFRLCLPLPLDSLRYLPPLLTAQDHQLTLDFRSGVL